MYVCVYSLIGHFSAFIFLSQLHIFQLIFNPKQQSLFDQKEKTIKPFGLRMKHI